MAKFDGAPYTQLTNPSRDDIQGVIKDISEALPENQTKFALLEDLLKFGSWASKVRTVTASGTVTLADTDPIFIEIDPNGSDRDVSFPAKSDDNHGYFVRHVGSANTLTLKRSGGATITTLDAGEAKYVMPSAISDFVSLAGSSGGGSDYVGQKRLSLESGVPISTTDQTAKTTVYWTDGNTNLSVSVPATTNTGFDIFYSLSAGTLSTINWTNDVTRATALVYGKDGYLYKSGDADKLYIGAGCTTDVSGQCEDSEAKRYLDSYFNQKRKKIKAADTGNGYNYNSNGVWREVRGGSTFGTSRVGVFIGWAQNSITVNTSLLGFATTIPCYFGTGVGIDSTTVNSALTAFNWTNSTSDGTASTSIYRGVLSVGRHTISHLEAHNVNANVAFYHVVTTLFQVGLSGEVFC